MGGCCSSSSRKLQLNGTPVYYCYPPVSEEHDSVNSHDGVATLVTSRILARDLNLNMSIPDTYQPPPTPIPYDAVYGNTQSTDIDCKSILVSGDDLEKHHKESNCKAQSILLPSSPRKEGVERVKSNGTFLSADEEECCPTCLEEYDEDNPKITTKCRHHFHLSCILEWMERSETCPICDQEMIYEAL